MEREIQDTAEERVGPPITTTGAEEVVPQEVLEMVHQQHPKQGLREQAN